MTVTSQSGHLAIDVRTSPQPPARGTNDVELTITGAADGGALDGLAIAVKPWMPAMGHGTSVVPTIAAETNGKYLISGVDLFMPGLWELRLTISGSNEDYAAPAFEIQ
jgi:subtilisin family serine protease